MSLWLVVGKSCAVDGKKVHAASTPRKKTRRKTYDTACGRRARLLGFPVKDRPGDTATVAWPPYVADAREWGFERCSDCMNAAPGKPQRPAFALESSP